jgi:predicted esterase
MRRLASLLGALLLLPAFPLSILSVTTPVSTIGFLYVVSAVLIVSGMVSAPMRRTDWRGVTRVGLLLLVGVASFRVATASHGATISMSRGTANAPIVDRLLPERDVAVTSARAVILAGILPANDTKNLIATLKTTYRAMDASEGAYPSPIVMTTLQLQKKTGQDTLMIDAPNADSHAAVLFLHGFGGNFTLQCWAVAQAARRAGAATFCPSTRLYGDWWRGDGPQITTDMLATLKAHGFDRIVLAGLSNGGVGASRIAPLLHGKIVGLLLISGASPDAAPSGVPTIAFEGANDTMMRPGIVQEYVENTGATYVELNGTHFLLIEHLDDMTAKMGTWLAKRFAP